MLRSVMMKRFAGCLAMSGVVPAAVFFVLAARPARLYAESAPAPTPCSDPNIEACSGKAADDTCTFTYGNDAQTSINAFCHTSFCIADGGFGSVAALGCEVTSWCVTQSEVDDCAGKTPSEACGDAGRCLLESCPVADGGPWDGGSVLACIQVPPSPVFDASGDAAVGAEPDAATNGQGCSCDTTGSPSSALGSGAGLLFALLAFVRRSNRALNRLS